MKILCISNTADLYGASRCIERVYGLFSHQGHEIHVVIPHHGPIVRHLEESGIHVHIQPGLSIVDRAQMKSPLGLLKFLAAFPLSVLSLIRLVLKYRIDLIHTNTVVLPAGSLAAKLTGRPHVWHVRELLAEFGALWKPYQRYMSFTSDAIVAISQCTRDQFEPGIRAQVHTVYDGLNDDVAPLDPISRDAFRKNFPSDKILIGCVGRIKFHRKGQEVLVQAAALLKDKFPAVHYVLVGTAAPGNEDHEVRLRALINSFGLEDRFTLFGDAPDPIAVFAALDVAVVPSVQTEPFGCVVIEAMTAGTAVVGSENGGIAEQIVDGVSGLLFPPGDAPALAAALERLLTDPSLRSLLAHGGRQRVAQDFQLETTCRELASIFSAAASREADLQQQREPL
jgi:glycosyltransferase involved in cell wall biosynthesis